MKPSSPSSTAIYRLSRRNFIQYASIWIGSSFIAGCTNSNQPSTSNSWLDIVTFGTNWIAEAEHGGFYQAMCTTGCAYATGIYKDYGLDVTIKMGGPQVPSGTQLLMGDAVDFFMGYGIDAVNAIAQGIPKIRVAAIFQKDPWCLIAHPNPAIKTLEITVVAFIAAAISGLLMAILFTQRKWIERSLFPYAVILQTTPIVAIAPLIILWLKNNTFAALVVCAWIVAFFPIVSNTTLGLNSVDRNCIISDNRVGCINFCHQVYAQVDQSLEQYFLRCLFDY